MQESNSGARRRLVLWLLAAALPPAVAQESTVPSEGLGQAPNTHIALTNARVVVAPGRVLEDATLVMREGRIVSVEAGARVPAGAFARDMGGKTLFPGFVEIAASVGVPADMRAGGIGGGGGFGNRGMAQSPPHQQQLDQPGARHWNKRVRPELSVAQRLELKPDEAKSLRALGFTAALAAPEAGLFAGQSALLSLREGSAKDLLLREAVAQHLAFDFAFGNEYPGSLMGAIALIRQTLLDADWQRRQREARARIEANQALDALQPLLAGRQGAFFRLGDELDFGRADALRREFGLELTYLGSGYEYRVLEQVRAAQRPMVLPLTFPEAPEVEKPDIALDTGLAELQHWEQAPANPARVAAAGLPIALTSSGLKEPGTQFWTALRAAVKAGLSEDQALAALTREPARLIGAQDLLGSLEPGRLANLVVADAGLFTDADATLYETWVEGHRFEHAPILPEDPAGTWALDWSGVGPAEWSATRKGENLDLAVGDTKFKGRREGDAWIVLAPGGLFEAGEGRVRLAFSLDGERLEGFRDLADGQRLRFTGSRTVPPDAPSESKAETSEPIPSFAGYPAGEFARRGLPPQPEVLLIRGATVWTSAEAGVIEGGDVLVRRGRIAAVGRDLDAPVGAEVIEARGLHLTPGLIDAHSHTAIARNVNEPSHAVTAEVRIGDVLDPTDINLYRQLAGGLTSALLLHGSANPMGGQSQTIKLRWGADAEGLKFEGSKPGIKFALGENVKQSNWGEGMRSRYPQTRMGVPELMRDRFNAARAYDAAMRSRGAKPRRDLRLEALAEILRGERLVHIHSYRHDEILMFARLAQEFDLPVGSFTHVLEGYKVADAIRDIGAGASTFSDWWAFKMEVWDAIPYNASLMHEVGVVVSLNSDSNELARRLNTEAAKAVQYGGMDETEALKLVTLNPARQMGIDARVGSLEAGKDADFVLWSGPPLSGFSRAEQTWIDGRRYFERESHVREEQAALAERERLLQKALAERAKKQSLHVDAPAKPAEPEPYVPGAPAAALHAAGHADRDDILLMLRRAAPARGLYHDGEDVVGCTEHGHQH